MIDNDGYVVETKHQESGIEIYPTFNDFWDKYAKKINAENKAKLPEFNEDYCLSIPGTVVLGNVKTSKPKDDNDEYGDRSEVKSVYPIG